MKISGKDLVIKCQHLPLSSVHRPVDPVSVGGFTSVSLGEHIAPDVEIPTAVSGLAYAALLNAGQVCTSTERVYVHESIFPQFTEELADFVNRLRLGDGLDEGTDIGPMIRDKFREKVARLPLIQLVTTSHGT